ncbi:hypothetical protein KY310_00450 [Candidatus Woesearchaeota archaeon]|nr:hypothetical protein [Candidatus Woesearchaeota archaeon]
MEEPWGFFAWEDIYEEHKYFVQQTLGEEPKARQVMNFLVSSVSCKAANRVEEHCLSRLKQIIDEFKEKNPGKEPDECDWLDFVFHYNEIEPLRERMLQDDFLKTELKELLEYVVDFVSIAVVKEYNALLNTRTKATWNW